jgi:hypothetical protein
MNLLRTFLRTGKFALLAIACWFLSTGVLFAKEGDTGATEKGNWVMAYSLVLLLISLAMIAVCRASTRRDRVRPEAYAEGKFGNPTDEEK